jgi:PII-like signaling protein
MTKLQLTIYLNETDMNGEMALHEFIVRRLLHLQIAGATVMRGVMGFGKHGQVHRKRLFGVSDDHPIVIVTVDEATRIRAVLPELKGLVREGLITCQEVEVV